MDKYKRALMLQRKQFSLMKRIVSRFQNRFILETAMKHRFTRKPFRNSGEIVKMVVMLGNVCMPAPGNRVAEQAAGVLPAGNRLRRSGAILHGVDPPQLPPQCGPTDAQLASGQRFRAVRFGERPIDQLNGMRDAAIT